MFARLFDAHPVQAVCLMSAILCLVGWFEYSVGKSRGAAYLTWGVTAISFVGFFILRLF